MRTTTNYTTGGITRKVDLYVQGPLNFSSNGVQQLSPTMAMGQGGKICAGIVKLGQKAFNTLMNYSPLYDYDWGTALTALLISGSMSTIRKDFEAFMAIALEGVIKQLQDQETDTTPNDERILDFALVDWQIELGTLRVALRVVSQIGEVMPLVVPISVVP